MATEHDVTESILVTYRPSFAQYRFADQVGFELWIDSIVHDVVVLFEELVGDAWSLDEDNYFQATKLEAMAQLLSWLVMNGLIMGTVQGGEFTLGAFTVRQSSSRTLIADLTTYLNGLHAQALAYLNISPVVATGIKIYIPDRSKLGFVF
jgi:hypothetical protein